MLDLSRDHLGPLSEERYNMMAESYENAQKTLKQQLEADEAAYGVSQADFISKMQIALKETAETEYWLKLLQLSDCLDDKLADSLINDCLEIKRILIASLNTAKENK